MYIYRPVCGYVYVRSHSQKSRFRASLPPLIGDKNVVHTYYQRSTAMYETTHEPRRRHTKSNKLIKGSPEEHDI